MKPSDEILQHIVSRHLVPAWQIHQKRLTLRAGDVTKSSAIASGCRRCAVCLEATDCRE